MQIDHKGLWQKLSLYSVLTLCGLTVACGGIPSGYLPPATALKTSNPLVAQYVIQSPCTGQAMVEFGPDTSYGRSTSWYPVAGNYQKSTILVAGMKASSSYHMRAQVKCFDHMSTTSDLTFATGALPSLPFPKTTVTRPNPSLSSMEAPGIELINVPFASIPAVFSDRDGNVIWYYDVGQGADAFPFKILPNGHIMLNLVTPSTSVIREIDLAGNIIRQTDISTLRQKLEGAGYDFASTVGGFHHDILPLPNGHLIVLVDDSKNFTDLPGYPGTTTVQGDAVVDLDANFNPVWAWNSFDAADQGSLDINRHLNGLPDWTHANALVYSPFDGNILISMRHQSWILKLDYQNGTGSGRVLWHLGNQGDFALAQDPTNIQPWLWFSFQHFPSLVSQNGQQTTLAVWDNGDDRLLNTSGEECVDPNSGSPFPSCYARPTIFQVDESAMVANLTFGPTLPFYSVWGGAINQLPNGNVEFDANDPQFPPSADIGSEVQEVTQTTNPQLIWKMDFTAPSFAYRAYRVPSLYPGVTWQN